MNRRGFLQLIPGLAALPIVGKWLQSSNTVYAGPSPKPWIELPTHELMVAGTTGGVGDDVKWAKNYWLDNDGHIIIEDWGGELTTKRVVKRGLVVYIEKFRMNAAGEWELTD